jgi:hypothetical protein
MQPTVLRLHFISGKMANEDGAAGELAGENQSAQRKPIPVPFCPPKIPYNLTQAAAARNW